MYHTNEDLPIQESSLKSSKQRVCNVGHNLLMKFDLTNYCDCP